VSYVDDLRRHLASVQEGRVRCSGLDEAQRRWLERAFLQWFEAIPQCEPGDVTRELYRRWSEPEFFRDAVEALHEGLCEHVVAEDSDVIPAVHHALVWILVELFDALAALGDAVDALQADFVRGVVQVARVPACHGRPLLVGHRDRFILALVNLLRNASQAKAASASIEVSVDDGATDVLRMSIDDDGPGVPASHRDRVFQPGISLRPGGSGRGLALVREVVEDELRGSITCTDSPLGGARFTLRLPFTSSGAS
jgi:hypothetical protein